MRNLMKSLAILLLASCGAMKPCDSVMCSPGRVCVQLTNTVTREKVACQVVDAGQ